MDTKHYGLFFGMEAGTRLQKNATRSPYKEALTLLEDQKPAASLAQAQLYAFRHRLLEDAAAGRAAAALLPELAEKGAGGFLQTVADTVVLAQCFELIREVPQQGAFLNTFFARVSDLNDTPEALGIVETLWLALLNMAAGVVLERESLFEKGVDVYRTAIDNEVHPEGYLPKAVDPYPEVQSLTNQIQAVQALVLMAEAAAHAGVDLWRYENRGVSVRTAVTYPLYYYFYPEQWKWNGEPYKPSAGVPEETARQLFRDHAGFLEIAAPHFEPPLKAIKLMLQDMRPVYDVYGGGLTTLTHAVPERRGLFG
ncbi:MAG: hypothetical protein OHK0046_36570 [Anaerolineae bacterium]